MSVNDAAGLEILGRSAGSIQNMKPVKIAGGLESTTEVPIQTRDSRG